MRRVYLMLMMLLTLGCAGCNRDDERATPLPLEDVVRTASAPVHELTIRIVGGRIPVELLCPPGQDPSSWKPTAGVVAQYQSARLIVTNGAGFEDWVMTAPLPRSRVVSAASGIDEPLLVVKGETHSHGPQGNHTHEVTLGQIWLDPLHAIAQAQAIGGALSSAFPKHEPVFRENLGQLVRELQALHERLDAIDASGIDIMLPQRPFGYLARRYGWSGVEIASDPAAWSMDLYAMRFASGDQSANPAILLAEQLPDPVLAETLLESHDVRVVRWDTCAIGSDGSFTEILDDNITRLESVISDLRP